MQQTFSSQRSQKLKDFFNFPSSQLRRQTFNDADIDADIDANIHADECKHTPVATPPGNAKAASVAATTTATAAAAAATLSILQKISRPDTRKENLEMLSTRTSKM